MTPLSSPQVSAQCALSHAHSSNPRPGLCKGTATGPQNNNARILIKPGPRAGREWDALPIFIILESGDCITFAMPDGPHRRGEGGGAYAYAPARHSAVFLFGRLRRWTRDRGCDLAHLILRFCRNKFFARSACVVDLMRLFFLGDAQAARLLIIRCLSILQQEKTPRRACFI